MYLYKDKQNFNSYFSISKVHYFSFGIYMLKCFIQFFAYSSEFLEIGILMIQWHVNARHSTKNCIDTKK
jgi:hypothetical protein